MHHYVRLWAARGNQSTCNYQTLDTHTENETQLFFARHSLFFRCRGENGGGTSPYYHRLHTMPTGGIEIGCTKLYWEHVRIMPFEDPGENTRLLS